MPKSVTSDKPETARARKLPARRDRALDPARAATMPASLLQAIGSLPPLPKHFWPLKVMTEADRSKLLDTVLDQYECGQPVSTLAAALGIDDATIYRNLAKYRPDEWIEISSARAHARVEQAAKELELAPDAIAVARAREQLAHQRWLLERLNRRMFGQDSTPGHNAALQININLVRDSISKDAQVIDADTQSSKP